VSRVWLTGLPQATTLIGGRLLLPVWNVTRCVDGDYLQATKSEENMTAIRFEYRWRARSERLLTVRASKSRVMPSPSGASPAAYLGPEQPDGPWFSALGCFPSPVSTARYASRNDWRSRPWTRGEETQQVRLAPWLTRGQYQVSGAYDVLDKPSWLYFNTILPKKTSP
jgi:hypothetical protein